MVSYVDGHVSTEVDFVLNPNSLTRDANFWSLILCHMKFMQIRIKMGESRLLEDVYHTPNCEKLNCDGFNLGNITAFEQMNHDGPLCSKSPLLL